MLSNFEKAVAAKLKYYRLLRGYTQETLANEVGVSTQLIQKYETATTRLTIHRAYNLTQVFKISLNDLLPDHCMQFKSMTDALADFENNDAVSFFKLYSRLPKEKKDIIKVVMKALDGKEP